MSTFVTRPRGEAIRDVVLPIAPQVDDGSLRPLDEVVAEWREAYVSGDEARRCECGGVVIASLTDPTSGVRDHQQTDRHRRWSRRVYG